MAKLFQQGMWSGCVNRAYGQVVLAGHMVRLCQRDKWSGCVSRANGQVVLAGIIMVRLCQQDIYGETVLSGYTTTSWMSISVVFYIQVQPNQSIISFVVGYFARMFYTIHICYYLSVQHIHPTISKHLSSSGILVLILINLNEVSGITCIGTVFFFRWYNILAI